VRFHRERALNVFRFSTLLTLLPPCLEEKLGSVQDSGGTIKVTKVTVSGGAT